jgi:predicted ferric reductase
MNAGGRLFAPDDRRPALRALCWAALAALAALMFALAAGAPAKLLVAGRALGLWALLLLLLQPVTALRLRVLDRAFGHDRLLAFHRWCGVAALGLAFLHPMVVYGPGLPQAGPSGWHLWRVGVGALALVALWLVAVSSLWRGFLGLSWEAWRRLHWVAVPALAAALVHATALQAARGAWAGWRFAVWLILLGAWAALLVRFRLLRSPRACTVAGVRPVAEGVTELAFKTDDGRPFAFLPGQFVFLRLRSAAVPAEEHPFTVASAADGTGDVRLAVKALGDFTSKLDGVAPGDHASLHGPFGRFTPARFGGPVGRLLLVAGGIGITPLLSVVRTLAAGGEHLPVTLIVACRAAEQFPYRDELEGLRRDWPEFTLHTVVTGEKPLDLECLRDWAPHYREGLHAMVCGPEPMMRAVSRGLRSLGYPRRAIHSERFGF